MTFSIQGADEIIKRWNRPVRPALQAASVALAEALRDVVSPYPRETQANRPPSGTGTYYVRGRGLMYKGKSGARLVRSSQTLGRKWRHRAHGSTDAILTNSADYSGYVHGSDTHKQARAMNRIGWVSTEDGMKRLQRQGIAQRLYTKALMRHLEG